MQPHWLKASRYMEIRDRQLYRLAPRLVAPARLLRCFLWGVRRLVPMAVLRGATVCAGQPGTAVVAGPEPRIARLPGLFFHGTPQREQLRGVPVWRLPRALRRHWAGADLVVARVDRIAARLFFGAAYLRVPESVEMCLELPTDLSMLSRGRRNRDVANDLRRIRQHGLGCEVSNAEPDLDLFYHQYYLPFVTQRYANNALLVARETLGEIFRRGGLLWVVYQGRRIAGALYQLDGGTLHSRAVGTLGGEYELTKLGALVATYHYEILHAASLGCSRVNFGGSQALLTDGLLRHKRKWGSALVDRPDSPYDTLMHWNRLSEPTAAFLGRASPVFRTGDGFAAISAVVRSGRATQADLSQAYRLLWTRGLQTLFLVSLSGWEGVGDMPPLTFPLDGANASTANVGALARRGHSAPSDGSAVNGALRPPREQPWVP